MEGAPRFRTVVFDCDSTLVRIEGIDELAGALKPEVQRLTDLAMDGGVALEEVYGRRLELIAPTRSQVEAIGRAYLETLVEDARETVDRLHALGVEVWVISGGLLPPVLTVARALGIDDARVAAVGITFDSEGRYAGFDTASPLARSGGKLEVLRGWQLTGPVLMVGDGVTDLETRPAVDAFAAFAGVVHRPAVVAAADHLIAGPGLAAVVDLVCAPASG
jgi:phosphoserine phosphatase